MALARVRGGDRGPALVGRAPAVHRPAAARRGDRDAAPLVGSALEVAGILHARARPDAIPLVLPRGSRAGVPARHRRAREPGSALADGCGISVLLTGTSEGPPGRHAARALRLHAVLE